MLLPGPSEPVTVPGRDLEESHLDRRDGQPLCCAPGQSCPLLTPSPCSEQLSVLPGAAQLITNP